MLLVERPGYELVRIAAERAVDERGWRVARSAADADALLCCGKPGPELDPVVERLFAQLPRPRARDLADAPAEVTAALDRMVVALRSDDAAAPVGEDAPAEADDGDMHHADMNHGDMNRGDMDGGGMDGGGMDGGGDMDMEMDMSGPGGIPLAGGATDRDGLEMDVLPVRLGPVLPAWPAGLVLSVTLAGDLITDASAEILGLDPESPGVRRMSGRERAALAADRIGWLLLLAGAGRAESRLRQVRNGLLDGIEMNECAARLRRLTDRLDRSRSLRWSLRDLGRIEPAARPDIPPEWSGDVLERLHRRLSALSRSLQRVDETPESADALIAAPSRGGLNRLADTVRGLDLGAARLVIASVDIEPTGGFGSERNPLRTGSGVPT